MEDVPFTPMSVEMNARLSLSNVMEHALQQEALSLVVEYVVPTMNSMNV